MVEQHAKKLLFSIVRIIMQFLITDNDPPDRPVTRQFPGRWLVERGPHNAKQQTVTHSFLVEAFANKLIVSNPCSLTMMETGIDPALWRPHGVTLSDWLAADVREALCWCV